MKRFLPCLFAALCLPCAAATFSVTTTADSGFGSFRKAIDDANGSPGPDVITFNIDGGGRRIILPTAQLPTITGPVRIDGGSQPGSDGIVPLIELDGSALFLPPGSLYTDGGLYITAGNCVVSNLAIHSFPETGSQILIQNGGSNEIVSCYIGLNALGLDPYVAGTGTRYGIRIDNSAGNRIGGAGYGLNVISADGFLGANVWIEGAGSINNVVEGNYIGTDPSGSIAELNGGDGVAIVGACSNRIGGVSLSAANVISGHNTNGVLLTAGAAFNRVEQNFIGTDYSGLFAVPNLANGISIHDSSSNIVARHNVICANARHGIRIDSEGLGPTQRNFVADNFIGLSSGGEALGNGWSGVSVEGEQATANIIGSLATPNWITRNGHSGIELYGPSNEIPANFVTFNSVDGITVAGHNNSIHDNTLWQNTRDGARLMGSSNALTASLIAGNHHNGVSVLTPGLFNTIRRNSITTNDALGIDLGDDGVTLNDVGDGDVGANHRQNFPVVTTVFDGANLFIAGTLSGPPDDDITVDLYLNATCDSGPNAGYGEGFFHLGEFTLPTDPVGYATFYISFPVSLSTVPGLVLTATATSAMGDTSEFSACFFGGPASALDIHREDAGNITLSWPVAAAHWQLQSKPIPSANLNWLDVTNVPVDNNNGRYQVTEPAVSTGKFYRLRLVP